MPRLTVVTHIYPDWTREPFGPYYLAWPAEVALSLGWDVEIVTTDYQLPQMSRGYRSNRPAVPEGAQLRRFAAASPRRHFSAPLLRHLVRHGGDVINVHGYGYAYTEGAWLVSEMRRRKFLWTPYYHPSDRTVRHIYDGTLGRLMVHRAAATHVFTSATVKAMKRARIPVGGVTVLPLPLNPATRRLLALTETEHAATGALILGVGGLVQRKGWERVIQCMPMLLRLVPEAEVILAGYTTSSSRPYIANLMRLALSSGVHNHLRLVTDPSPEVLASLYSSASVFTFASRIESFGLVLLEAMAARLTLVVDDSPAIREIVGDAGIYVDASSPDAYGAALAQAISHCPHELGPRAQSRVDHHYTPEALSPGLASILERMVM